MPQQLDGKSGRRLVGRVLRGLGASLTAGAGVGDAPQGQAARRVALDEQLVEGLPAAEEEAGHRRADQELAGHMGGGGN